MSNQVRLSRRQLLAASTGTVLAATLVASNELFARQTPVASPEASPVASGPQLHVSATEVQFDEAFEIGVTGLNPGDEVTIRSELFDYGNKIWTAEASYIANEWGVVGCSSQSPISGDFDVPDSMAFIWAATSDNVPYYTTTPFGPEPQTIMAAISGIEIGNATIERTILPGPDTSTYIYSNELAAQYYEPVAAEPTPAPAVIVLGGSEGGISQHLTAALLASHGYAALAVGYFDIGNLPQTLENIPLEYFANAIAWLQKQPNVDASRLGVLGYSRGGELALLLGSWYPEFTAVVSYVGSGYIMPGYNPLVEDLEAVQPAWTWGGEAIPYYPVEPDPMPEQIEAAEIPVEQINGPILLIAGEGDMLWDSSGLSRIAWDRLQRTDHPWPSQFLNYPGAGHAITSPFRPMTFDRQAFFNMGGDPASDQIASVNSWAPVLNMFEWRLKQRS